MKCCRCLCNMTKCVLMHRAMYTFMSFVCMIACCDDFKLYMHPVFIHCTRTNTHTGGAFATEKDILTEFARNNESYNCILAAVVFVKPSSSSSSSSPPLECRDARCYC